jgi:hypothetical protein
LRFPEVAYLGIHLSQWPLSLTPALSRQERENHRPKL